MTALLALTTVLVWGSWIPLSQIVPGIAQHSRTFYAALGNAVVATVALVIGGTAPGLSWRAFWLPLAGGIVWTLGNYGAFRATELIGLARASGTWTPINIVVAFVWGAALFGELDHLSSLRFAVLGAALAVVLVGIACIVRSQGTARAAAGTEQDAADPPRKTSASRYRRGFAFAGIAGVLWGSYFVPAQWAKVSAQVGNFPLAIGILVGAAGLAVALGRPERLSPRVTALQLAAGALFGVGNITLLGLVARIGTGTGFTIAQMSLLVNVSIGILVFKVPPPHSRAARLAVIGIACAGVGGITIGAIR